LTEPNLCLPDERLEDLQRGGLRILQKRDGYRFGMDAVLLAHFARLRPQDKVADMGTGTGVLPILMSQTEPTAVFHAFERQADMADMARRSVELNGLGGRITIHAEDLRNAQAALGAQSMTAVVCNPPYGKRGVTMPSQTKARLLACHETECGLADVAGACAAVLKNRGRLWMCFPAARVLELADELRAHRLEPKRARMVCSGVNRAPYLLLLEAVKNAKPALCWLPPLIVSTESGAETDEIRAIYGGGPA